MGGSEMSYNDVEDSVLFDNKTDKPKIDFLSDQFDDLFVNKTRITSYITVKTTSPETSGEYVTYNLSFPIETEEEDIIPRVTEFIDEYTVWKKEGNSSDERFVPIQTTKKISPQSFFLSDTNIDLPESKKTTSGEVILGSEQSLIFENLVTNLKQAIRQDEEYLREEGAEQPAERVFMKTVNLVRDLAYYNIFPYDLTTTIEGGLCLIFKNEEQRLFLELYNDGDIGYIIEDIKTRNLLENIDLDSISATINRIRKFHQ
jgi:hypothetical protein